MIERSIIEISVIAGALLTIVSLIKLLKIFDRIRKRSQRIRKWILKPIIDTAKESDDKNTASHTEIMKYVDELKKEMSDISDKVLKMAICTPHLPLEERVDFGNEYVEVRHKNGKVKAQHEINKKQLYEQTENENIIIENKKRSGKRVKKD